MKQLKNFLIKREQSQACLSFAKREKSRLLAKTILTLVALLAVTTGAWADGIVCTASDLGKVLCTDGSIYENVSAATTAGKEAVAMIAYVDETNKNGLALALTDIPYYYTWDNSAPSNEGKTAPEICSALNTSKAVTGGTWKLPSKDEWKQMFSANGGNEESYTGLNTAIGNAGGTALLEYEDYWSSSEVDEGYAWLVHLSDGNASWSDEGKHYSRQVRACLAFDIAASSGPEVAWDKAKKTGQFTMPGGNVTLEPEYYPQAALTTAPTAINNVPATTDGAIVNAGTVANIGETATAQGTVMYYVSQTALDDAALLALAADQWTADVPTAAHLAQGQAYIYYYVRGNDSDTDEENFSDGDILAANALTVTIAAEPTYAVTFADDLAEPTLWSASPAAGVKKGQTVTVTYTGTKKVIGVKAEKKAAEPVADIVWDATNVSDLSVPGTESYEKEGVTLSANAHMIQAQWYNFGDPTVDGIGFNTSESGGFTFTAPTGKAFTKIEMTLTGSGEWQSANLGTGWAFNADMDKQIFTVTWTGSAASKVDLLTGADDFSGANVKSIAFYLSE